MEAERKNSKKFPMFVEVGNHELFSEKIRFFKMITVKMLMGSRVI